MSEASGGGPHEQPVGQLLPCPCCGASNGYRLTEGTTYRWWHVECAACGQEFGECPSDRRRTPALLNRHRAADKHWNEIAAHADSLRADARRWQTIAPMFQGWSLRMDGTAHWVLHGGAIKARARTVAEAVDAMAPNYKSTPGWG